MPILAFADFGSNHFDLQKHPILLVAGKLMNEDFWESAYHVHRNCTEIIYVAEGNGLVKIGSKEYSVTKGDLVIYNEGMPHLENFSDSAATPVLYFCQISDFSIGGVEEGKLLPPCARPVLTLNNSSSLEYYFKAIIDECNSQRLGYNMVTSNLLLSMLVLILRELNEQYHLFSPQKQVTLGNEIKNYIDTHFKNDIGLKELADRFHVSSFYLSHIFRNEVGDSPINYLIQRRIDEAKKLLLTTSFSIQKIALMVGYENASYFNIIFKKFTTHPPGRFRELSRQVSPNQPVVD